MKYPHLLLSLLLLSGCTGVQSAGADASLTPTVTAEAPAQTENDAETFGRPMPSDEELTESENKKKVPMPDGTMVQTFKPLLCQTGVQTVENIQNNYGEQPFILGFEPLQTQEHGVQQIPITLWMNIDTGTFTILQALPNTKADPMICILSTGQISKVNESMMMKMMQKSGTSL